MEPYLFYGTVLPTRAQISLSFDLGFSHITSGNIGRAKISIVLNEVAVTVHTEKEWNIFDLRNVVKNIVQSNLAMIGYLKGFAYDLEITRVLNSSVGVDYVFGIDVPCIAKPREPVDLGVELEKLKLKTIGANGVFLSRCFNDLIAAMKYADDTGFYCYRAIEALRHHCASVHKLVTADKNTQWQKFRDISGIEELATRSLEDAARVTRHGEVAGMTDEARVKLFNTTWNMVDSYIAQI